MLEAIDGFILVLGTDGHILYTSESLASLLGYLPSSLHNTTLYEMVADTDKIPLYNTLNTSNNAESGDQYQVQKYNIMMKQESRGHISLKVSNLELPESDDTQFLLS